MRTFFLLIFGHLLSACQNTTPISSTFFYSINPRVAKENQFKHEFRSGQCFNAIKNAETILKQTQTSEPTKTASHNQLAWLLITCPNKSQTDPSRALELLKRAEKISPLIPQQLDTLACTHAALGNFTEAIKIAENHQLVEMQTGNRYPRAALFKGRKLCEWDGSIGAIAVEMPSEAEQKWTRQNKETYETTLNEILSFTNIKPPNIISAIETCDKNRELQYRHFCRQDLAKKTRNTVGDRFTYCENYEKEKRISDLCYTFFFEEVAGDYQIGLCKSGACRTAFCKYRKCSQNP